MLSFSAPITAVPFFGAKPRPVHPKRRMMLIRSASEIQPRLWLSGLYTAVDEEQLVRIGITHVVSILEQRPKYPAALKKLKTLHIPLQDVDTADLLQHFDATTAFIKSALEDKRNTVLVHCAMGISRSATVVSAYLIATAAMQPHEAIEFVQSKREIVCPNLGFRRQLDAYASRLRGSKKLRKPVAPPVRATASYKTGWRWFLPPEHERFCPRPPPSHPSPRPPPSPRPLLSPHPALSLTSHRPHRSMSSHPSPPPSSPSAVVRPRARTSSMG